MMTAERLKSGPTTIALPETIRHRHPLADKDVYSPAANARKPLADKSVDKPAADAREAAA